MSIVITGTGVVSPLGIGKDAFMATLLNGESGGREFTDATSGGLKCAKVADFDFGLLFSDRRFRRAALVTQYALVAAGEALKEAGLDFSNYDGKRVGVVCGVTHGALGYSCDFHKGFSTEGPLGASPVLFSDSVLNAPTGALSLAFGIKGPTHTLIGGPDVGVAAIEYGADLVRDGKVDTCLVVSSEALHERIVEAYVKLGFGAAHDVDLTVFGEGAGAVVIERGEDAAGCMDGEGRLDGEGREGRGVRGVAGLASARTMIAPGLEVALKSVVEQALNDADLKSSDITGVMLGGGYDDFEGRVVGDLLPDAARLLSVRELIGEAFCAGTLMNVVAAVNIDVVEGIAVATNVVAATNVAVGTDGGQLTVKVDQGQRILFLVAGHGKEAGCLILKRP